MPPQGSRAAGLSTNAKGSFTDLMVAPPGTTPADDSSTDSAASSTPPAGSESTPLDCPGRSPPQHLFTPPRQRFGRSGKRARPRCPRLLNFPATPPYPATDAGGKDDWCGSSSDESQDGPIPDAGTGVPYSARVARSGLLFRSLAEGGAERAPDEQLFARMVQLPRVLRLIASSLRSAAPHEARHPLGLLLFEAARTVADTFAHPSFVDRVEATHEYLHSARAFLDEWGKCLPVLWACACGSGSPTNQAELQSREERLRELAAAAVNAACRCRYRPRLGTRLVAALSPHCARAQPSDTAQVHFAALMMLLLVTAVTLNLCICVASCASQSWAALAAAVGVAAVQSVLFLALRRRTDLRIVPVFAVVLSLSYHHLLLEDRTAPPAELFGPLWLALLAVLPQTWRWRVACVALREAALLAFLAARAGVVGSPWPEAPTIFLLVALPVVLGCGVHIARSVAAIILEPVGRAAVCEHYYRTLSLKAVSDLSSSLKLGLTVPASDRGTPAGVVQHDFQVLMGMSSSRNRTNLSPSLTDEMHNPLWRRRIASGRDTPLPPPRSTSNLRLSANQEGLPSVPMGGGTPLSDLLGRLPPAGAVILPGQGQGQGQGPLAFDAAVLHGQLPIFALDVGLNVLDCNAKLCQLTGLRQSDVLGHSILDFVLDPGEQHKIEALVTACQLGLPTEGEVLLHINSQGGVRARGIVVQVLPLTNVLDMQLVGAVAVGRDVAAEQCAAEYIKWMHQEFSTALDRIVGLLDPLADSMHAEERPLADVLSRHLHALKSSLHKFEPLYTVGPGGVSGWQPMNVRLMAGKLVSDFTPHARHRGNQISFAVAEELPAEVYTDLERLPGCIARLVHNANRFTENGEIHIQFSKKLSGGTFGSSTAETVRLLAITVSDNGKGMGSKRRVGLFNLLKSPKRRPGMALVKVAMCIQQMGGSIECFSRRHKGSVFEVTLPLLPVPDAAAPVTSKPLDEYAFTSILTDSSPAQRNALCSQLWMRRHAVTMLQDETQLGQVNLDSIEIAITEIDTPAGRQLLHTVQQRGRGVQVIAMTADPSLARPCAEGSPYCCLVKPLRTAELAQALDCAERAAVAEREERRTVQEIQKCFRGHGERRCRWSRCARLGQGAFAEVFLVVNEATSGFMAMKEMPLEGKTEAELQQMLHEIALMFSLSHKNIVHYFYCERTDEEVLIFMEYVNGGCLQEQIKKQGRLDIDTTVSCCKDVLKGLSFLHLSGVVHRDIKSANVLLSRSGVCKLSDFGCAAVLQTEELRRSFKGTPNYMAPEVFAQSGHDMASDVWSVGVLVYEMLVGAHPWTHIPRGGPGGWFAIATYVGGFRPGQEVPLPSNPKWVFGEGEGFIRSCMKVEPKERPTPLALLNHAFVCNGDPFAARFQFRGPAAEDALCGSPRVTQSRGSSSRAGPEMMMSPLGGSEHVVDQDGGTSSGSPGNGADWTCSDVLPSSSAAGRALVSPNADELPPRLRPVARVPSEGRLSASSLRTPGATQAAPALTIQTASPLQHSPSPDSAPHPMEESWRGGASPRGGTPQSRQGRHHRHGSPLVRVHRTTSDVASPHHARCRVASTNILGLHLGINTTDWATGVPPSPPFNQGGGALDCGESEGNMSVVSALSHSTMSSASSASTLMNLIPRSSEIRDDPDRYRRGSRSRVMRGSRRGLHRSSRARSGAGSDVGDWHDMHVRSVLSCGLPDDDDAHSTAEVS
eukprot:TRINITY_DN124_c0_g4_i1.p1 TRINITY_DN124_c0_g4~~TRINITY_DN124_c0_g4_i1.p1  ORF type:complete len:1712 (+),score=371.46 TRINITY_DN124_c0_g4_i1:109-5244(+)